MTRYSTILRILTQSLTFVALYNEYNPVSVTDLSRSHCVITLAEVSVHPIKFILLYSFSISSKSTCRSFRSHCKEERKVFYPLRRMYAKILVFRSTVYSVSFTLLARRRQGMGEPSGSHTLESRSSFHRVTLRKDWRFVRSNMMIHPLASR